MELPKNYNPAEEEPKWQEFWEKNRIYKFDEKSKSEIYSVDTPPPTVSGKMHMGHAFSYSQQDFVIRYKRMKGFSVFYPFGTDDNGLATERLIEKTKNVKSQQMDRKDFVKLCLETLKDIRKNYVADWKRIGMSCDWDIFYTTIDPHCQRISQRSFIELYKMGREYRKEAPAMWCPECQTAISQVECEDKELSSYFNDIIFKVKDEKTGKEEELVIATTRPELLPACVAVFFHPDDDRYKKLNGKKAKVPLFNFDVPIMPDERADPEKGTGIVMCCTFGDQTDMEWQKAHNLPIKTAITKDGKMTAIAGKYEGMSIQTARKMMIEEMKDERLLITQTPIKHAVKVHERCGTEIEFIHSKQWFIKYLDLKEQMLEWGEKLNWYPKHMKFRYDHWVKGLAWDWLISRQRFFGVPFPVWYCKKCDEVILAREEDLPVDPLKDEAPIDKCPKCGNKEFIAEKDVLDTWATSSLTPQLSTELLKEKPIYKKLYPMSLRPQAHDIITFWLFNTVIKNQLHFNKNPWKDVVISGFALDPHGKKMSKKLGNIVEPQEVIKKYSADALRFWAAGSRLGDDLPYQEKDLVTGNKMTTKLWNASKFAIMHLKDYDSKKAELKVMDRWMLSKFNKIVKECTEGFDNYEYYKTKLEVEKFFWNTLCDNYLEIIKDRLYKPEIHGKDKRKAAQCTLYQVLLGCLKLFAPIMPHITEAVYQIYFAQKEKKKSIHISSWPEFNQDLIDDEAEKAGDLAVDVIGVARKFKSEKNVSLKTPIKKMIIKCTDEQRKLLELVLDDVKVTTAAEKIEFGEEVNLISDKFNLQLGIEM